MSDYITKLKQGESYSITSPVIEGYKADKNIVKGIAGDGDITVTVTYSKIGGSSSANTSTDKADPMESETLNDTDDTTVPQSETDVTDDSYENDSYSDKYESDSPDPMDSRDDEDPDEIDKPNTIVESEAQVDVTVETIVSEVIETNVKYNYELLFKVITISTLICGCIIAAIIKWEKIVKVTLKFVKDIVKKD